MFGEQLQESVGTVGEIFDELDRGAVYWGQVGQPELRQTEIYLN